MHQSFRALVSARSKDQRQVNSTYSKITSVAAAIVCVHRLAAGSVLFHMSGCSTYPPRTASVVNRSVVESNIAEGRAFCGTLPYYLTSRRFPRVLKEFCKILRASILSA